MAFVIQTENNRTIKEDFDPNLIEFRPPKVQPHGGKTIGVSYKGKPLMLQLPEMKIPFGVSIFTNEDTGIQQYSLDFSFQGKEENPKLAKFHAQLKQIEDVIVRNGVSNSVSWFNKVRSEDVVRDVFSPIVRVSKDKETKLPNGKYPDTFKVKLPLDKEGMFTCKAFNEHNELYTDPLDVVIKKGTLATALVQASFVYVSGSTFGITFKPLQMRLKVPSTIGNVCILEDDETGGAPAEGSRLTSEQASSMAAMGRGQGKAMFADDDEDTAAASGSTRHDDGEKEDDEEEDEEEEVDVPAPVVAPPPAPAPVQVPVAAPTPARRRRAEKA